MIRILAIESSCDDTSVAIFGPEGVKSLAVQSQNEIHEKYGGIVPELASRAHLQNLIPCLRKVLQESNLSLEEIDVFAATERPGLIGSLIVGHTAAKTLSFLYGKPFIGVHHIEGHLNSVFLGQEPQLPLLTLVVSGGHTSLYIVRSDSEFELLGETLDDAAGEAFDKGAKLLGLGFPGGPLIDQLAKSGNAKAYRLGNVQTKNFDFSFSGLKSDFSRLVSREGAIDESKRADLSASYQSAIMDHILEKIRMGCDHTKILDIAIVGGVASNSELRRRLSDWQNKKVIRSFIAPALIYCTDNAAMIARRAYSKFKRNEWSSWSDDIGSTSRKKIK